MDLIVRENNLPTTMEDLSQFVLFGDEAVNILRAQIAALKKCGAAKDVVELQLKQAQTTAENVTIAKIKLGELLAALPKATTNHKKQNLEIDSRVDFLNSQESTAEPTNETVPKVKPKAEAIKELGISQKQSEQLQQMAKNPDAVHAAMAKARENDDVVSQSQILNEIKQTRRKEDIQRQVDEIEQQAVEKPDGLFDVIVIDPPWNYGTQLLAEAYRAANPYPEMTQAELKAIELPAAGPPYM